MRVGYCRVSTAEQNTARQEVLLESLSVERVFVDRCSGKNTDRTGNEYCNRNSIVERYYKVKKKRL